MKKFLSISLIFLVIIAFATLALAQEKPGKPAAPAKEEKKVEKKVEKKAEKKEKVLTVKGEVVSVDTAANTLVVKKVVKDKAEEVTLAVTPDTKITVGKEKKALADLKAGDKVTAKYVTDEAKKNVAKSIAKEVAKKVKEKAKEEKAKEKAAEPAKK